MTVSQIMFSSFSLRPSATIFLVEHNKILISHEIFFATYIKYNINQIKIDNNKKICEILKDFIDFILF